MEEIWKDVAIESYGDFYEVSNLGKVRSKDRDYKTSNGVVVKRKGKLLANSLQNNGYHTNSYTINNKCVIISLHKIVALTFIPKEDLTKNMVNHKNGNKIDNRVDNLEWCTAKENSEHSYSMGLSKKGKHHYSTRPIGKFTLEGDLIETFDCLPQIKDKYGFNIKNIHCVIVGKRNKAHDFIWKYV